MEESMAQRLFLQLLEAVKHCHTQRVCHRDLKLENFVLDKGQAATLQPIPCNIYQHEPATRPLRACNRI